MVNQRSEVMTVIGFPRSGFQAGHQTVFGIQADMGYVAVEILDLLFFLAFFGVDFALMLDTPVSVRIAGTLPLVLALSEPRPTPQSIWPGGSR